jgi:hypothetical protein
MEDVNEQVCQHSRWYEETNAKFVHSMKTFSAFYLAPEVETSQSGPKIESWGFVPALTQSANKLDFCETRGHVLNSTLTQAKKQVRIPNIENK